MSPETALKNLEVALKNITDINTFGNSVLAPAKFDQFVRRMEDRTVILPDARFLEMDAHRVDIDRVGFVGRILHSGADGGGDSRTLSTGEFADPTTNTNQLVAQELQAVTSLRDRALRRNIERGNFENTLLDLFGQAAGRDFEEYGLFADTELTHSDDDLLSKTDGWLRRAVNKLYGRNVTGQVERDFDAADALDKPTVLFQALIDALPKRFAADWSEWRIYVPWEIFDAYRDELIARETGLGDMSLTENTAPPYKGIPVVYAPMLERAETVDLNEDSEVSRDRMEGRIATLQHPDNMIWGVFHEVTVEDEREAKERRTDFVLTFEGDVEFEDENAGVVAFVDKANPETV